MAQAPENVSLLIAPAVTSLGYELVGVEYLPQGKHSLLRVYIDSENGITLEDCEKVSHQLSGLLDVEDVVRGHYNLEISSPGLDRPLFTIEHFQRFSGEQVKLRLKAAINERRKFKGTIVGVNGDVVILDVEQQEIEIPIATIEKANLVPDI